MPSILSGHESHGTALEAVERWKQASERRKFWFGQERGGWFASVEDETFKRMRCSAKTLERACQMLLAKVREGI